MNKEYYIVEREQRWVIKETGVIRPVGTYDNRKDAIAFVRRLSDRADLKIRVQDSAGVWTVLEFEGRP